MKMQREFLETMTVHGIPCPDAIISDGGLHRFNVPGDKSGSHNGWYVLFGDNGFSAGAFGSWKTGETFKWCGKNEKTLSSLERTKFQERIVKAKNARDQEQKKLHAATRKKAAKIWQQAKSVKEHPYLNIKGVKSHGLRQYKDSLVLPIIDTDGTIHSLQFINSKGNKRFLSGGAITGHFYSIEGEGDALLVCEGYSTGASLHEATGYPVVCALNCGNLKPVCEALHKKLPDIKLIICSDDDYQTDGNPGITKAKEAAEAVSAGLAAPKFEDQKHRGTDFNDLHQIEGLAAVQRDIENVSEIPLADLASLLPFEYDRQRAAMAEKFGVRVGTLDQEVEKLRRLKNPEKIKSLVEELEPWPESVTGAELLERIYEIATDYVIMPRRSAVTFSLWTLLTYTYSAFRILPILGIISPEKRCGKTRLLEVLSGLACHAFSSSNLTSATVYRVIEKCRPCLLIDEADTFLPNNDELRGVVNSGHAIKTAFVTRCNHETNEPERFSTWCPKAIALIGKLPGTLEDRAICISLKRKLTTEKVTRFNLDFDDDCLDLRRKCLRWATNNIERLKVADPQLPDVTNDRALDNWTPLLAIADLVGGSWSKKARSAMVNLEAGKEDDSARVMLLQDIKKVFVECECEKISSQNLIDKLMEFEERPWGEWKRGKPLSKVGLSRMLKPFGIVSNTIRISKITAKGYYLKCFTPVFDRYLPQNNSFQNVTTSQPAPGKGFSGYSKRNTENAVTFQNPSKPACIKGCDVVTFQNGDIGEKDRKEDLNMVRKRKSMKDKVKSDSRKSAKVQL